MQSTWPTVMALNVSNNHIPMHTHVLSIFLKFVIIFQMTNDNPISHCTGTISGVSGGELWGITLSPPSDWSMNYAFLTHAVLIEGWESQ